MPQTIFIASAESVESMPADENPADAYPCMPSLQFHREARAQLYALVTHEFLEEAGKMEHLDQTLADEGPYIFQLSEFLRQNLASLDESQIEAIAESWMSCQEIEELELDLSDVHDFMFQFVHLCQVARDDDLSIYIYSDD